MELLNRLLAMLYKEMVTIVRDKRMRAILIAVPLIQTVILGYAVNMDLKNIETAIVDNDNTQLSKQFADKFFSTDTFIQVANTDMNKAEYLISSGDVMMIINIPEGFSAKLINGKNSPVQIILDATNSVNTGMATGYISNVLALFNQEYVSSLSPDIQSMGVVLDVRNWFNDNFESRELFVPSLLAMLLMIITVLLSSMAIVNEKEKGTLEQLSVSPITAAEFIAGKCIPFAIVSFVDVILIICVAVFWFKISLTGSLPLLLFASFLYILCMLGIGLLISAISSTQQQAMMTMFMLVYPLILLSGFAFPIDNMPEVVQWTTYANPMRYFLVIIRGVFLKGLSIDSLVFETISLTVLALIYISVTFAFLRKRLN